MTAAPQPDRPRTLAEAAAAVAQAYADRRPLTFWGGGTKDSWGAATSALLPIDTTGLNRIIEHDAADLTATVQAGIRLADLQAHLRAHGQWLPIDPPLGPDDAATVGGVFCTNDVGPRRLAYGSLRELVIGMTAILGDGTVVRSGSKVIKNVAGYDLCKLFCGSLGTLGLVTEVTVRLLPLPKASTTVQVLAPPAAAQPFVIDLMASAVEPSAIEHTQARLTVRFDGSQIACRSQADTVLNMAKAADLDAVVLDDAEAEAALAHARAAMAGDPEDTVIRIGTLPGQFAAIADAVASRGGGAARVDLNSQVALGLHTVTVRAGAPADHEAIVLALRQDALRLGGHAQVRRRVPGLRGDADFVFGPPPASWGIMQRLKAELDPARICAPGRFVGGL